MSVILFCCVVIGRNGDKPGLALFRGTGYDSRTKHIVGGSGNGMADRIDFQRLLFSFDTVSQVFACFSD